MLTVRNGLFSAAFAAQRVVRSFSSTPSKKFHFSNDTAQRLVFKTLASLNALACRDMTERLIRPRMWPISDRSLKILTEFGEEPPQSIELENIKSPSEMIRKTKNTYGLIGSRGAIQLAFGEALSKISEPKFQQEFHNYSINNTISITEHPLGRLFTQNKLSWPPLLGDIYELGALGGTTLTGLCVKANFEFSLIYVFGEPSPFFYEEIEANIECVHSISSFNNSFFSS